MKKLTQLLTMAAVAVVACLGTSNLTAQDNAPSGDRPQRGGGQRGGGGGGGGNWDPAQMQQRMMERYKERLEITNDDEWKALEPLVQKVMDARMQSMAGIGRGMFGRGGGPGGDNNGGQRRGGFGGEPSPTAEALQKAIDSKASASELKAALAKYEEARKAKQAELEKAQANLRKVLSVRQEALATLNGLL
jgi:hypothetical protein